MATSVIKGAGTTLKHDAVGGPFTGSEVTVAEVRNIRGPSQRNDEVDVTHMGSSGREFIPALPDFGRMQFPVNFLPEDLSHDNAATGLWGLSAAGGKRDWRLTWPTTNTQKITTTGFVQEIDLETPVAEEMRANISIRLSGSTTWS